MHLLEAISFIFNTISVCAIFFVLTCSIFPLFSISSWLWSPTYVSSLPVCWVHFPVFFFSFFLNWLCMSAAIENFIECEMVFLINLILFLLQLRFFFVFSLTQLWLLVLHIFFAVCNFFPQCIRLKIYNICCCCRRGYLYFSRGRLEVSDVDVFVTCNKCFDLALCTFLGDGVFRWK